MVCELVQLGLFWGFSLIYSIEDIKTRYINADLLEMGIYLMLVLNLCNGIWAFTEKLIETASVYFFLSLLTALWYRVRRKVMLGLADVKYLAFLSAYKGFLFAYLSFTIAVPVMALFCSIKKCKYAPFIPFLFIGAILSLIIWHKIIAYVEFYL